MHLERYASIALVCVGCSGTGATDRRAPPPARYDASPATAPCQAGEIACDGFCLSKVGDVGGRCRLLDLAPTRVEQAADPYGWVAATPTEIFYSTGTSVRSYDLRTARSRHLADLSGYLAVDAKNPHNGRFPQRNAAGTLFNPVAGARRQC